jgi:uracil-DNA glycosylase family 4
MGRTVNIAEDIKTLLQFYQSLGFERLPISVERKGARVQESRGSKESGGIVAETRAPYNVCPSLLSANEKERALEALREEIGDCQRCMLSKGRKNIVFGEGSCEAALMFIGEGPGEDEDIQARPFVGKAGQTLRSLIGKMGMKESEVYIANVVKCRPPSNRTPLPEEITTCIPFLRKQIEIIAPRVIMLLGNVALQGVMSNPHLRITAMRGTFIDYEGIRAMPTFHPSYLLRNPKDKWLVWEDAQKVIGMLGEE